MLRRAENAVIVLVPHFLSSKGHIKVQVGRKFANLNQFRMTREEYKGFLSNCYREPFRFTVGHATYWLFQGKFYKDSDGLRGDEVKALLITRDKLQRSRINRAKTIAAVDSGMPAAKRGTIPDDTKLLVWQRDKGKCVRCGSNIELQFDHVIPASLGGASTPENLQILCGRCNRAKSASVT